MIHILKNILVIEKIQLHKVQFIFKLLKKRLRNT